MSIIVWIILGLIAGWIASKIMHGSGSGFVTNLVLGIVGAFVGGIVFRMIGGAGVTGLNIWSILVAVVGAVLVLWVYNAVAGRRRAAPRL